MNSSHYRQFHFRFRKLAESSGYAFVYESLKLMQEFIPCSEICLDILRPKDKLPATIEAKLPVLSIATEKSIITLDYFYNLFLHIPFAKRNAQKLKQQYLSGEILAPLSFDDDEKASKGIVHDFYLKGLGVSDTITIGGLLDTHQLVNTEDTEHGYVGIFFMARNDDKRYTGEEKQLFAYCFEIFLAELKQKIKTPEDSPYLPYLLLENFKPREFAAIKTCFDLKLEKQPVTRVTVAKRLHLQDCADATEAELKKAFATEAELKKALDKVDYDLKKIKKIIFNDLAKNKDESVIALQNTFDWRHIPDVFKIYAYFGFYPDSAHYLHSYLQTKMGDWATE